MKRILLIVLAIIVWTITSAGPAAGQSSNQFSQLGISKINLARASRDTTINSQATGDPFIDPANSLLKLKHQATIQFLPADFSPAVEPEQDPDNRSSLRYAVAYYRDCQAAGFDGLVDIMVGIRFDTRDGLLSLKYFRTGTIVNPTKVQLQGDRLAMAVAADNEGSALLFFKDSDGQVLVSFQQIFEDPHAVNAVLMSDLIGVKTDESTQKFAVFARGGNSRNSLFVLNTDSVLQGFDKFEIVPDLPSNQQIIIFEILGSSPPYRAITVK